MPITSAFRFAHADAPPQPTDLLGLLSGFLGSGPQARSSRKWKGKGFNMIWRPNFGNQSGPKDFFLELNLTDETLEFSAIPGGIANRGLLQHDIVLGGISYLQQINDSFDGSGQHFEPGIWAHVPATTGPTESESVVRMASIPHGTTVNLQGLAISAPAPIIQTASITPFRIGNPAALVHFPEEQIATVTNSRTPLPRVPELDQAHLSDPNLFLKDAIAGQTFVGTTVLIISSDHSQPAGKPDIGGGTDNIAFLQGTQATGPNADAAQVTSIFWIERVRGENGKPDFDQLQYTQRVLLNFNGLSWPHITVATLHPVDDDGEGDDHGGGHGGQRGGRD